LGRKGVILQGSAKEKTSKSINNPGKHGRSFSIPDASLSNVSSHHWLLKRGANGNFGKCLYIENLTEWTIRI